MVNRKFEQLAEGQENQSDLVNRKFEQLVESLDNQSELLNRKFEQVIALQKEQISLIGAKVGRSGWGHETGQPRNFEEAMQQPLLIDDRTYNTNHPNYEAKVRNYPGKIFSRRSPCANFAFNQLVKRIAEDDVIPDDTWDKILAEALVEAASVPAAVEVFERRAYIENYMTALSRKYHAHYVAGWVNLADALFLYWLVRQLRPNKIVQCGACNGLSSSFMMLALAKNSPDGTLSIIDLPRVFDPKDPDWTREGMAYGVCIPEGKSTAWMVPNLYRDRLDVRNGDAKILMPRLIDELESVDFFYHDSDHTYRHMMFEFEQAKRKLSRGGVVVADDISWNAKWHLPAFTDIARNHIDHFIPTEQKWSSSFVRWFFYYSPYSRIFEFILGCLTAHLYLHMRDRPVMRSEERWSHLALAVALICLFAAGAIFLSQPPFPFHGLVQFLSMNFLCAVPIAALIFCVSRYPSGISRFLCMAPLVLLGEVSYSIYSVHTWTLRIFIRDPVNFTMLGAVDAVVRIALGIDLTLILATATYRLIEVPGRAGLRRFFDRSTMALFGPRVNNFRGKAPGAGSCFLATGSLVLFLAACLAFQLMQ